jgi:hypothetical protein
LWRQGQIEPAYLSRGTNLEAASYRIAVAAQLAGQVGDFEHHVAALG